MKFSDLNDTVEKYHLYASKKSKSRSVLRSAIVPMMDELLTELRNNSNQDSLVTELTTIAKRMKRKLQKLEIYQNHSKKSEYLIIDYLFFLVLESHSTDYSKQIIRLSNNLANTYNDYIILHELATLSWHDKLIDAEVIFSNINNFDISQNHLYHILTEMSLSYPKHTIDYVKHNYGTELLEKLYKKMIKDRSRDQRMSRKLEPVGTKEEIEILID